MAILKHIKHKMAKVLAKENATKTQRHKGVAYFTTFVIVC